MNSAAPPSLGFKLTLIGSLYVTQALPIGFAQQALPVLLRAEGVSLRLIGMASVVSLPWALKFLWAPRVDRMGAGKPGHRKAWILPLQLAACLLACVTAFLNLGSTPGAVISALLLLNLVCATQDIATDALAVRLLRFGERGPGNGIQSAGYQLGLILGGGVMLLLFDNVGWQWMLLGIGALMLLPVPLVLAHHEPATPPATELRTLQVFRSYFRRPGARRWTAVLCLLLLGNVMGMAMFRPLLIDLGLNVEQVGWLIGMVGILASIAGSLLGGWVLRHVSRRTGFWAAGLLLVPSVGMLLLPVLLLPPSLPLLYTTAVVAKAGGGFAGAVLFTLMMDHTRPEHAGTDFTLQQSTFNIATILGAVAAGYVAQRLGYVAHFSICLGLTLAFLPLLAATAPTLPSEPPATTD